MDIFPKKSPSQDNVERDSVSNDTSAQTEATPPSQPPANQPAVKKEKHSRSFSFVSILFLLTLLGAGYLAYLWYNQTAEVDSLNRELSQVQAEQAMLKKQIVDLKNGSTADPVADAEATADDDAIKEEVVAYNRAYKDSGDKQFVVEVTKKEATFAWATFGLVQSESGGKCLLKKVDTSWVILFCGQSTPTQANLDSWGVPKDF